MNHIADPAIYVANTRTTNSTTVHMADDDVEKVQWGQSLFEIQIRMNLYYTLFSRDVFILFSIYLKSKLFGVVVASIVVAWIKKALY